jgi:outer membrane protein assembly factor BamA
VRARPPIAALLCTVLLAPAIHAAEPTPEPAPEPLPTQEPTAPPTSDDFGACAAKPVARVHVDGCGEGCQAGRALLALVGLARLGETLPPEEGERLRRRLDDSKLAARSRFTCIDEGDTSALVLGVEPMTFVRRVRVTGNDAFRRKDILKRVFLRAGTPLPIDPARAMEDEQVQRQVESLERLYRQAGLDDAHVEVIATRVDATHIDLELRITEGVRTRIEELTARHVHTGAADPAAADGLRCPTIDQRRLERLIGLGVGDAWTRVVERKLKERLRKAFQAAGFERPKVTIEGEPERAGELAVTVETDSCWLVRVWQRELATESGDQLSYRWTDPIGAGGDEDSLEAGDAPWRRAELADFADTLPFGESGSFERDEAMRGVDTLAAELRARGYPFAEVRLVHRVLGPQVGRRNGDSEVTGIIDYFVTLNLERRLEGIRVEGNAAASTATIAGLMKTGPYDFFGGSGAFDEARVLADLQAIAAWYRERGFFAFRFVPPVARPGYELVRFGGDDRPFAVEKLPTSPHLMLVIRVDEGERARLGAVTLTGLTLLSQAEAERLSGFSSGRPLGPAPLRDGLEKLARWYRQRGHHRLTLSPTCRDAASGDVIECTPEGLAGHHVIDFSLAVVEGPLVRVAAVVWRGNAETDVHVLVRDLPKRGEVLDFDRINDAVRKMRALAIFNSVRVDVAGLEDDPPRDVVLVVAVEETQYRFLDVALGVRSIQRANIGRVPTWAASGAGVLVDQGDRLTTGFGRGFPLDIPDLMLTFDFEYLDLNSLGRGNRLQIPFDAGFSLSQFLRLATFNPSYTIPRLLDGDLTLTARGIAEMDRVTDPLDRLELGLEGDLLVPILETMSAGFNMRASIIQLQPPADDCVYCLVGPPLGYGSGLGQELAEDASDEVACDGDAEGDACADGGFRPQFTVGLRWRWDTQDTPLHPTRGVALAASTSFILDRDRLSSAPVFNQFLKWDASARAALSLGSIVAAAYAHYGGSATFDEAFLPADERFTLGGSNGMRGFADNGICRYDRDGKLDPTCPSEFGGNVVVNGSFELRVPVLASAGVWIGAFFDWGALARSHDELYPASFRLSSGVGVRWLLGGLFPIRLDVGFPLLERRCVAYRDDGSCVREEPSQVHFGLLYTF